MRKIPLSEAAKTTALSDPIPVRLFECDLGGIKEMAANTLFRSDAAAIRWLVHECLPVGKKQFCRNGKAKS